MFPRDLIDQHMQKLPLWTLDASGRIITRRGAWSWPLHTVPPSAFSATSRSPRQLPCPPARRRTFTARNFMAAMRFLNEVAELAERETHHPNLHLTSYRRANDWTPKWVLPTVRFLPPPGLLAGNLNPLGVDYSRCALTRLGFF